MNNKNLPIIILLVLGACEVETSKQLNGEDSAITVNQKVSFNCTEDSRNLLEALEKEIESLRPKNCSSDNDCVVYKGVSGCNNFQSVNLNERPQKLSRFFYQIHRYNEAKRRDDQACINENEPYSVCQALYLQARPVCLNNQCSFLIEKPTE